MAFPFPLFTNFTPLKVAFYIAILLTILFLIKYNKFYFWSNNKKLKYEGFSQTRPFLLKEDNEIYDDFYIEIYDELHNTIKRTKYDINKIIEITNLNKETANILDIGCGTGCLVNEFTKKGILIKGIDKSKNMINYSNNKYKTIKDPSPPQFEYMDAENPIIFERVTFTHVLCLYMTIYEIKDKTIFFNNAFYGLQPGGYLILHLIDNDNDNSKKYNGFIDLGKPKAIDENTIINSGITKLETNFGGFVFKKDWTDIYNIKETFVDNKTNNIRQNEMNLYYEPINVIIEKCKRCGFVIYDKILEDNFGILYFFTKLGKK